MSGFFYGLGVVLFGAAFPMAFGLGVGATIVAMGASLASIAIGIIFQCVKG